MISPIRARTALLAAGGRFPLTTSLILALTFTAGAPPQARAQSAQEVLQACYVPATGIVYVIGVPGRPDGCIDSKHVAFKLTGLALSPTDAQSGPLRQGDGPLAAPPKQEDDGVLANVWHLFGNEGSDPTRDRLGTLDFKDLVIVTNAQEALRIGADGNIGLTNDLEIGEDLTVKQNVFLNTVGGQTTNNGAFAVAGSSPTSLTGTLGVTGATTLGSTLGVTGATTLSSALGVGGNTTMGGTLAVTGVTSLGSTLGVAGNATVGGTLGVIGATSLSSTLGVSGAAALGSTLGVSGATSLSSSLGVTGAATLGSTLGVTGETTLGGALTANGQVTIKPSIPAGVNETYADYPLRVEGGTQGVAIKINGQRDNDNDFVTFWDAGGVQGRIEGQTTEEILTDPEYIFFNAHWVGNAIATAARNIAFGTSLVPSLTTYAGVAGIAEGILMASEAVAYNVFTLDNPGVSYESGAGDYAEWLPKETLADDFSPGEVVGVKGGSITSDTDQAEQVLVISTRPAFVGNMPEQRIEHAFEKVAFMGQVPVRVRGRVDKGDYIVPSGLSDGFGRGVKPGALLPEQYKQIVGVAWSTSHTAGPGFVNVAVGLNANDVTTLVIDQMEEIAQLRQQIDRTNQVLAELVPGFAESQARHQLVASVETKTAAPESSAGQSEMTDVSTADGATDLVPATRAEVMRGIEEAERQMLERGVDPDNHPFLQRLRNDSVYRELVISGILAGLNEGREKALPR